MSDDKKTSKNNPQADQEQAPLGQMPITVHTQYIRDVSFENPNAPGAMRGGQSAPEMEVNINTEARNLENDDIPNLFEVALIISATARRDDDVVFIAEIVYGVTVSIGAEVPEEHHHPILFIEVPRLAFPFARQILANLTIQGGYPPLLINPVDFQALYYQRFKDQIDKANKDGAAEENNEKEAEKTIN